MYHLVQAGLCVSRSTRRYRHRLQRVHSVQGKASGRIQHGALSSIESIPLWDTSALEVAVLQSLGAVIPQALRGSGTFQPPQ